MSKKGVNKVTIIGNVGADPAVRELPSKDKLVIVRIATSESWKDKDGKEQEHTEWHTVVFNKSLAAIVEQYVKKGSKLYVEGKLKTREYSDKDGVKKRSTEIMATEMQMLDSKPLDKAAPAAAPKQEEFQGDYI